MCVCVCVCVCVCLRERDGTWGSKGFKLEGYSIYKRETPHFKNSWWKIGRCSVPNPVFPECPEIALDTLFLQSPKDI